ncbi:hypothetical protein F53441_8846 [Fusarium austroafricanum]|uniref:Uncharacterized protein n=1 Tax=Fusarium austroafricanum TaxID=2364996 RepID=A0A8H4KC00_9HYPO|nr:hypothetical protein F53441_8846 [Fusarium austroafricanum]
MTSHPSEVAELADMIEQTTIAEPTSHKKPHLVFDVPASLEYPRLYISSNVKFAGCAILKPMPADFIYPSWWEDMKWGDRPLSDRNDLLVVVILGKRGTVLPNYVAVPSNTRVIDYLSYDVLLPYARVFVMNAGYSGFFHAVKNSVPLVLAGEAADKPELAIRGEWSRVAINFRKGQPTPYMVKTGVERVLTEDRFKKRVDEIKAENEAMKLFNFIEEQILSIGE